MNDESLCLSIKDIETMLAFFALNKKWELMDSKVQARARKDGTSKVKMEFVIRPLDDLKTPDREPESSKFMQEIEGLNAKARELLDSSK